MNPSTLPALALSLVALFVSTSSRADVDIPIDALANCLDTDTMAGGKSTGLLPPGRYRASLVDNTMRCDDSSPDRRCAINTVIVRGVDYAKKVDTMLWGFAVTKPLVVEVRGAEPADLSAFVLDNGCANNVGTATLRFHALTD
jgi:hypothetical protein